MQLHFRQAEPSIAMRLEVFMVFLILFVLCVGLFVRVKFIIHLKLTHYLSI